MGWEHVGMRCVGGWARCVTQGSGHFIGIGRRRRRFSLSSLSLNVFYVFRIGVLPIRLICVERKKISSFNELERKWEVGVSTVQKGKKGE